MVSIAKFVGVIVIRGVQFAGALLIADRVLRVFNREAPDLLAETK